MPPLVHMGKDMEEGVAVVVKSTETLHIVHSAPYLLLAVQVRIHMSVSRGLLHLS